MAVSPRPQWAARGRLSSGVAFVVTVGQRTRANAISQQLHGQNPGLISHTGTAHKRNPIMARREKKALVWNGFFRLDNRFCDAATCHPCARACVCVHKARGGLGPQADGWGRDSRIQTMLTMFSK